MGSTRITTDLTDIDLDVVPAARGRGVGFALSAAVVAELRPLKLERVLLSTLDAHDLYRRVGFESFPNPEKLMQLADG